MGHSLTLGRDRRDRAIPTAILTGHYMVTDTANDTSLDRDAHAITTIGIDGVVVSSIGDSVSKLPASATIRVTAVHARGLTAELLAQVLVAGFDGRRSIGDCLPSPTLRDLQRSQPSWSKPGPVGGLPWATIALDARLATGVSVAQIELGVAGNGYFWPGNGLDCRQPSDNGSRTPAGDLARWNPTETEWKATLPDDTVVW